MRERKDYKNEDENEVKGDIGITGIVWVLRTPVRKINALRCMTNDRSDTYKPLDFLSDELAMTDHALRTHNV